MKKERIARSILAAEMVLLVPLLGMALSDEWDWGPLDFILISVLLAFIGLAYQLIVTGIRNNTWHTAIGIVLAASMILLWIEMAVGLFGSPIAGS